MKFISIFNKTALSIAVEYKDKEIINLLLQEPNIDANFPKIFIFIYFI